MLREHEERLPDLFLGLVEVLDLLRHGLVLVDHQLVRDLHERARVLEGVLPELGLLVLEQLRRDELDEVEALALPDAELQELLEDDFQLPVVAVDIRDRAVRVIEVRLRLVKVAGLDQEVGDGRLRVRDVLVLLPEDLRAELERLRVVLERNRRVDKLPAARAREENSELRVGVGEVLLRALRSRARPLQPAGATRMRCVHAPTPRHDATAPDVHGVHAPPPHSGRRCKP